LQSSPEPNNDIDDEKMGLSKVAYRKIEGIIPKDIETKKEMMSFIAYPSHLENACKLIASSKLITFSEGPHDKNRIYLSGSAIMSTKLTVSLANSIKLCGKLQEEEIHSSRLKRMNFLEK